MYFRASSNKCSLSDKFATTKSDFIGADLLPIKVLVMLKLVVLLWPEFVWLSMMWLVVKVVDSNGLLPISRPSLV